MGHLHVGIIHLHCLRSVRERITETPQIHAFGTRINDGKNLGNDIYSLSNQYLIVFFPPGFSCGVLILIVRFLDLSLLLPSVHSYLHQMLRRRIEIKRNLEKTYQLPEFSSNSECRESTWKVAPIPRRLQCRHIDLGDVSPSNTEHLTAAMNSSAHGIQVSVFMSQHFSGQTIMKTGPCHEYPLKPHFYTAKLGYAGVFLFFLFLLQNINCEYSLEPPRRGGSNMYPQSMF